MLRSTLSALVPPLLPLCAAAAHAQAPAAVAPADQAALDAAYADLRAELDALRPHLDRLFFRVERRSRPAADELPDGLAPPITEVAWWCTDGDRRAAFLREAPPEDGAWHGRHWRWSVRTPLGTWEFGGEEPEEHGPIEQVGWFARGDGRQNGSALHQALGGSLGLFDDNDVPWADALARPSAKARPVLLDAEESRRALVVCFDRHPAALPTGPMVAPSLVWFDLEGSALALRRIDLAPRAQFPRSTPLPDGLRGLPEFSTYLSGAETRVYDLAPLPGTPLTVPARSTFALHQHRARYAPMECVFSEVGTAPPEGVEPFAPPLVIPFTGAMVGRGLAPLEEPVGRAVSLDELGRWFAAAQLLDWMGATPPRRLHLSRVPRPAAFHEAVHAVWSLVTLDPREWPHVVQVMWGRLAEKQWGLVDEASAAWRYALSPLLLPLRPAR